MDGETVLACSDAFQSGVAAQTPDQGADGRDNNVYSMLSSNSFVHIDIPVGTLPRRDRGQLRAAFGGPGHYYAPR